MIEVDRLSKQFKVLKRREGLKGSIQDLFSGQYQRVDAVQDISFQVRAGEIVGFLGPNGAGKSTTIKMLVGVLEPSAGKILINGFAPFRDRRQYVSRIGVVFGQRNQLWWDLPVIETFKLLKEIYEVPDKVYQNNLSMFNEVANINALFSQTVRSLSLGQRMICNVAAAFLHDPALIFLDEPSIGLDVAVKHKMRHLIQRLNQEKGTTIILTSHDMGDVETLCERIVLIDQGRLIYDGETHNFHRMFGDYRTLVLQAHTLKQGSVISEVEKLRDIYPDIEVKAGKYADEIITHLEVSFNQETVGLVSLLADIQSKISVQDFTLRDMDMEQVIHRVYSQ